MTYEELLSKADSHAAQSSKHLHSLAHIDVQRGNGHALLAQYYLARATEERHWVEKEMPSD